MKNFHIFEMPEAKDKLGIVADNSKLIQQKKLKREDAVHSGTFEECQSQKQAFINNPKLLIAIREVKEKEAQKEINKLLKKHM